MKRVTGFTLVEMIIAIVILGIVAGMVSIFIARPIQGYVDSTRRAQLTDMADLALKRMSLEIRTALPNSVRPIDMAAGNYIEFIPVRGAGRYCTDSDTCSNRLTSFGTTAPSTGSFDVMGTMPAGLILDDQLIIYNTQQTGLNAYNDDNCATITSTNSPLSFTGGPFPYASPSNRFFVAPASGPVKFSCSSGTSVDRIQGSSGFCGLSPTTGTPVVNASFKQSTATLVSADSVSCAFTYNATSVSNGLVTLRLTLTNAGESVTLATQFHVDNLP